MHVVAAAASVALGVLAFGTPVGAARARSSGDSYRTVAQDGRCLTITADLVSDRVDFWVFHGKVIEAKSF